MHFVFLFEFMWAHLARQPLDAGRVIQIIDLKGLGISDAVGDGLFSLKATTSVTLFGGRRGLTGRGGEGLRSWG